MKNCLNSKHVKIGDELIITALIKTCNSANFEKILVQFQFCCFMAPKRSNGHHVTNSLLILSSLFLRFRIRFQIVSTSRQRLVLRARSRSSVRTTLFSSRAYPLSGGLILSFNKSCPAFLISVCVVSLLEHFQVEEGLQSRICDKA
jgi:hypothetical protein